MGEQEDTRRVINCAICLGLFSDSHYLKKLLLGSVSNPYSSWYAINSTFQEFPWFPWWIYLIFHLYPIILQILPLPNSLAECCKSPLVHWLWAFQFSIPCQKDWSDLEFLAKRDWLDLGEWSRWTGADLPPIMANGLDARMKSRHITKGYEKSDLYKINRRVENIVSKFGAIW